MSRFDHHKFLQSVANDDVAFILKKDREYGASWKRSGGISAWFMLVRKIDRLQEMMKMPDINEKQVAQLPASEVYKLISRIKNSNDIFAKIEEDPTGNDGTVLAEIRDLRRYLLLVEAEMQSRWFLAPAGMPDVFEQTPGTPENGGHHAQGEEE